MGIIVKAENLGQYFLYFHNWNPYLFSGCYYYKINGKTIIIVSHSMTQIEQICERIILIENGKVGLNGKLEEVLLGQR